MAHDTRYFPDPDSRAEHLALMAAHGRAQARCSEEIARLQAEVVRLRAAVMARDTALAWAREEAVAAVPAQQEGAGSDDYARLESSLEAADLVICQTGCLSHGAYWRVQDHCRRTGKACVQVEQPGVIRIVRIQPGELLGEGATAPR